MRWAVIASVVSFVGLGLAVGLLMRASDPAADTAGAGRAPQFSLPDVNDPSKQVSLPEGEPTVLYFFASWCVPCREELPIIQRLADERDDVAIVGINHLDHRDDAREFMNEYGATSLVAGHDPSGRTAIAYRLRGLPVTVFIDADGRIASTMHGQVDRETLDERIDELVLQERES